MRRSPLTISSRDVTDLADSILAREKRILQEARAKGMRNLDPYVHRVAVAESLRDLVRKNAPGRQKTIFEAKA